MTAAEPLPEPLASSVADFIEHHCLLILHSPEGVNIDDMHSRLRLVQRYRSAVREHRVFAADAAARVLLALAMLWSDRHGFDPAWRDWS